MRGWETIEDAQNFAFNHFPKETAKLNAAFYTRIFDASVAVEPSKDMRSPFFA